MSIIDRIFSFLSSDDIIDLYFVQSDLKDVHITAEERATWAGYDSEAMNANGVPDNSQRQPGDGRVVR